MNRISIASPSSAPIPPSKAKERVAWLTELLGPELSRVESRISEVLESREPRLTEISDYLVNAGGKRIRPAVALLVFKACGGGDVTDMVDLCVSLELIHTATLLHDDIIDSNDMRRGKDAAPLKFGIADTLVTGDFLFCRAFEVCGRFEPKVVAWAADACVQLTEGEIMQARFRRNVEVTEADYMEIIGRKTSSLFAAGSRIAAYMAGTTEGTVDRMNTCGLEIGAAFQMIDDLLDITGDARRTGKRVGTDLLDGNPSLPVVAGLGIPAVRAAFTAETCTREAADAALAAMAEAGLPEKIRTRATEHATTATGILSELPPSPYRDCLTELVADLVDREV